MKIERQLHDEVLNELEELRKMEVGSDKYKVAVDGVTKLIDKAIEIEKLNVEADDRVKALESESDLKREQMSDDKKDRIVRNVIAAAGVVLPLAVTVWGTVKSIEFEKEGTITTIMGRGFISKMIPRK